MNRNALRAPLDAVLAEHYVTPCVWPRSAELHLPPHIKHRLRLAPPHDLVRIAVECQMGRRERDARYRNGERGWRTRYVYRADRIGSAEDYRRWREREKAHHEELFGHLVGRERLPMAPARE